MAESIRMKPPARALEELPALTRQFHALKRLALLVYLPTLSMLAALTVISLVADIPLQRFFTDPVSEFGAPMYIGLVSNIGVVLWASGASACLLGALVLWGKPGNREQTRFLLSAALVTGLLTLDDLFLLHEEILPERLGIPEPAVMGLYAILLGWFIVRFRRSILGSDYLLLIAAGTFFAASVLVDLFVDGEFLLGDLAGRRLIEDGLKLLGIVGWSTYLWRSSMQALGPKV